MKKVSGRYVFTWIAILFITSFITGFFAARKGSLSNQITAGICIFLIFGCTFGWLICYIFSDFLLKRTCKRIDAEKAQGTSVFIAQSANYYINVPAGQITVVTKFNPFQIQTINAKNISDIKSGQMRGLLGGVIQTYFGFRLNNKFYKIGTFSSNKPFSKDSIEVITGISKADQFAEILEAAKSMAEAAV